MKRKIIHIDEEKCTGCGQCIPDCPEGALQLIDGKARLVSDLFCDGLGACIGTCPEGAITVIEREAGAYDEKAVMANVVLQGPAVITAHLEHLLGHGEHALYQQAIEYLEEHHIPVPRHRTPGSRPGPVAQCHPSVTGCPGSAARVITRQPRAGSRQQAGATRSELRQWPVQLRLLNPYAGYFDHADLLIVADCVPFAFADFHREFLKDKLVIVFCPKLDADIEGYITKLSEIFSRHHINSITLLRMEVPCCSGTTSIVKQAMERSGKKIPLKEYTITVEGEVV
ncbi:MAG TPA: 4Fe-4S binding protein [Methanoregulaceae archaeon]|nr:MAG: 4Fe-4S binding protein [Methanolinea sp.]HON80941.1 4Fe-4S binding protein [Methanoregulaceae archaeon]HPD09679.1 4Fe-4S binding protein [Methanoregulaceae archaeon]HRT15713.1 4Fe-4S binding protein [Methanoregulaceae archaeon]HRU31207.1 4Fe-4S binding protein [Methanoregulaceae archaeon]